MNCSHWVATHFVVGSFYFLGIHHMQPCGVNMQPCGGDMWVWERKLLSCLLSKLGRFEQLLLYIQQALEPLRSNLRSLIHQTTVDDACLWRKCLVSAVWAKEARGVFCDVAGESVGQTQHSWTEEVAFHSHWQPGTGHSEQKMLRKSNFSAMGCSFSSFNPSLSPPLSLSLFSLSLSLSPPFLFLSLSFSFSPSIALFLSLLFSVGSWLSLLDSQTSSSECEGNFDCQWAGRNSWFLQVVYHASGS